MPIITLPDKNQLQFEQPITVYQIAERIGTGLAKAAIAGKVNGQLVDLDYLVTDNADISIITDRDSEGLDIIRHSTAHLLAHAVKQLFPDAQLTIGPVIENGFYYDFAYSRTFTPEDIEKIEQKMHDLAKQNLLITHKTISKDEALKLFQDMGEKYKTEIISELPPNETITIYQQGDFIDPCRGPHVPSTNKLKAFKLTKLAGAYWRGDSNNEMLQRIYGTAWPNKKDLQTYLERLEEAEKRDHRKIGKALDLFHFQEEAAGMVFWHGKGWQIYQTIIQYMREKLQKNGYQEIATPIIADKTLWEKSGHWDKFGSAGMFTTQSENRELVIKPMNCPGHIQIFNHGLKSYRDLPFKIGEFGMCHRNEPSGTLHGLLRIRQFTQDDAHVFCTKEQLHKEIIKLIDMVYQTYQDFGFNDIIIRLATRPEKRIGEDAVWNQSETALETALNDRNIKWELAEGEGAFYGPKIEFHLRDCLDRVWQCGTIQIDFSMPERLGAQYIDEEGARQTPIMIHRAILGSIERFIGILIEHYAGKLPLWLAPIQAIIMNISDKQAEYCKKIAEILKKHQFRVNLDLRNEKIGFKIRQHTLQRVPYMLIVGDRELELNQVSIRTQQGENLNNMSIEKFVELLEEKKY